MSNLEDFNSEYHLQGLGCIQPTCQNLKEKKKGGGGGGGLLKIIFNLLFFREFSKSVERSHNDRFYTSPNGRKN